MSRTLQFKRFANTAVANTTGADGELIIDSTNHTITVHDGTTVGGTRLATETLFYNLSNLTNTIYTTANQNYVYSVSSYNQANSAAVLAQNAYNTANSVVNTSIDSFARDKANSANILAQSAYNQANSEPIGAAAYTQSVIATTVSQSAFNQANTANLIANTAAANISVIFGIDATQNTWISSNAVFTQSAYDQANSANILAQSAYNTANAATNGYIQNAQTGNYVLQLSDAGKYLYYTPAANVILYLPTTANVAYTNGTTIVVVSQNTAVSANITVSPNTGVSLFTPGNTISGSHNVTPYGVATLMMVKANTWFVSGFGVN